MQRAMPRTTWLCAAAGNSARPAPPPSPSVSLEMGLTRGGRSTAAAARRVRKLVSENALMVFGREECCMCHVLKLLLEALGVNPTVYEIKGDEEAALEKELAAATAGGEGFSPPQLPAVFIGGKLFGGLEKVMAAHISGELVPILKDAGTLRL